MTPRSPKNKKQLERTIPTRSNPLTTSGSGQQNPVAPNPEEQIEIQDDESVASKNVNLTLSSQAQNFRIGSELQEDAC